MQPQPVSEIVYYQDASVFISSVRAVFNGQAFFTRNIISINIKELEVNNCTSEALIIAGLILSCFGIATLFLENLNFLRVLISLLPILVGLALFIWSIISQINSKNHFALVIDTSTGPVMATISADLSYITAIQNALIQAISKR